MTDSLSRRDALKHLALIGGAFPGTLRAVHEIARFRVAGLVVAGKPVELAIASLSAVTVRLTLRPVDGDGRTLAETGAMAAEPLGKGVRTSADAGRLTRVVAGDLVVRVTDAPPTIHVERTSGETVQTLTLDANAAGMSFRLPSGPLLGLGEGGPQFDRKGNVDTMRNGQGGYKLATNGTRAPIQWLVGSNEGWAMFVHQPYGAFDLTGDVGKFTPAGDAQFPLDVFVVASKDPAVIMREYARITGLPSMPPRWALGYQQSHRTLGGPDEILGVAKTMREKKLPCDTLIYLGTEFAPSGWNTRNGEFTWHKENFPDPQKMIDTLHGEHFRVVLHVVIEGRKLTGRVADPCTAAPLPSGRTEDNRWPPDRQVSCYWPVHRPLIAMGIDGWWPDQGDGFDGPSRFNRHRMYHDGPLLDRPNERPFALHRNASAGVQRFGAFIWSGDVQSRWETLATHIPIAVNTGLSGLPFWGTDVGGFVPTTEFTGELFVRWFQFGAFNPLFRSHGRNWHLHTPWGWNGGDGGPQETGNWRADPAELHNADVEPICRKYLELRYRMLPYLYTAIRDTTETGLPVMRALWLHYPDDPTAAKDGTSYLWGRDILVAPVVAKGATSRSLYLPRGQWWDFWTETSQSGGRTIERAVDLATMPLYVRAGATIPLDPVRQFTEEPTGEPTTLVVYPGTNGTSTLYDDDGHTLGYQRGDAMRIVMSWNDATRRLSLRLAPGTKMRGGEKRFIVRAAGSTATKSVTFTGRAIDVQL